MRDPAGGQLLTLGCRQRSGRRDVHEVVGPLADDLGVADRRGRAAEHAELPVSHLEAVAVGAMQDIAGPSLAEAGNVRDLIAQAGRDEEPSRRDRTALVQHDAEARKRRRRRTRVALPGMIATP